MHVMLQIKTFFCFECNGACYLDNAICNILRKLKLENWKTSKNKMMKIWNAWTSNSIANNSIAVHAFIRDAVEYIKEKVFSLSKVV